MEIELNGNKFQVRDPLYKDTKRYLAKIYELKVKYSKGDDSAILDTNQFRIENLIELSNNTITLDFLDNCKSEELMKVLEQIDESIMGSMESKKK